MIDVTASKPEAQVSGSVPTRSAIWSRIDLPAALTVDPLLALAPLSSDVKHVDAQLSHVEPRLADTRRLCPRSQHVVLVGDVIRFEDLWDPREKVRGRVHEVKLGLAVHDLGDDGVVPYRIDRFEGLVAQRRQRFSGRLDLDDPVAVRLHRGPSARVQAPSRVSDELCLTLFAGSTGSNDSFRMAMTSV